MGYTLNDALLSVVRYCLPKHAGAATGGSITTLVDSVRKLANDQVNDGVIFFLSGTFAGQYRQISNYASNTGTFTFSTVGGAGIVSGVLYEAFQLMSGANPYDIISAINQALADLGEVLQEDDTLTTVDQQESYDLPAGVYNIKGVEIGASTSEPYQWRPFTHYKEMNGALRIPFQFSPLGDGYPIRLTYRTPHDVLDSYGDEISYQVNHEWLTYQSAINLIQNLANRGGNWADYKVVFEKAEDRVVHIRPLHGTTVVIHGA